MLNIIKRDVIYLLFCLLFYLSHLQQFLQTYKFHLLAGAAVSTAHAILRPHALKAAMNIELRNHQLPFFQQMTVHRMIEFEIRFLEEVGKTGLIGLPALEFLGIDKIFLPVLDEMAADGVQKEIDFVPQTVVTDLLDPLIVTGPCTSEPLSANHDGLNLT